MNVRVDLHIHREVRIHPVEEAIQDIEVRDRHTIILIILELRGRLIIRQESSQHPDLHTVPLLLQAEDPVVIPVVDHLEAQVTVVEEEDNCEFNIDTVSQLSRG